MILARDQLLNESGIAVTAIKWWKESAMMPSKSSRLEKKCTFSNEKINVF